MYSYEERMKAVELYIKYDLSTANTVRKLGYPDRKMVSEKVVRRIMKEEQLVVSCKKKRKYSSYKGEISPAVKNVIARDFYAASPNTKWLTDLTEFHIPAGKIYLSPIIDCFDGMAVSWTIGTSPNAELVNTMLDDAISNLTDSEHPIVHCYLFNLLTIISGCTFGCASLTSTEQHRAV